VTTAAKRNAFRLLLALSRLLLQKPFCSLCSLLCFCCDHGEPVLKGSGLCAFAQQSCCCGLLFAGREPAVLCGRRCVSTSELDVKERYRARRRSFSRLNRSLLPRTAGEDSSIQGCYFLSNLGAESRQIQRVFGMHFCELPRAASRVRRMPCPAHSLAGSVFLLAQLPVNNDILLVNCREGDDDAPLLFEPHSVSCNKRNNNTDPSIYFSF